MAEPMPPEELERHTHILSESRDSARLAGSAVALASSEDPEALLALGRQLRRGEFLARLDDLSDPSTELLNLTGVFRAMADHPAPSTGRLCELLYAQPEFIENPSRINPLLSALAAVRPTSAEAAEVFRASSAEGYAETNGPLLLRNESPLALDVFEELIAGDWVDSASKVEILHRALLPMRTNGPVLELCARLLEKPLEPEVRDALIETLFDYQSRRWFGPLLSPPVPPAWESAGTKALDLLLRLADRAAAMALNPQLRQAVDATGQQLRAIRRTRPS